MGCSVRFVDGGHTVGSSMIFDIDKFVHGILEIDGLLVQAGHHSSKALNNPASNVGRKSLTFAHLEEGKTPWCINHIREVLVKGLDVFQALFQ